MPIWSISSSTNRLQQVEHAVFRSYERPEPFRVAATVYALCMGGLENARFLLNANRQMANGIGNANDLVGRFFNEHPHQDIGQVLLVRPLPGRSIYAPTPAFMAEQEILNFGLVLDPYVRELSLSTELARTVACQASFTERLVEAMRGKAIECDDGGLDAYYRQWRQPEILMTARLHIMSEQAINPSSRVLLGDETDRFGLRRIELDSAVQRDRLSDRADGSNNHGQAARRARCWPAPAR